MSTHCPKCGCAKPVGAEACAGCGLIFAKFDPDAAQRLRTERLARQADSARARKGLLVAGVLLMAAIAGGGWWISRPDPYAATAPVDVARSAFSGQALGYAGPGAELRLADVHGGERTVGRIDPDGRFRFDLPADMPPVPLPPLMSDAPPAGDPSTWNDGQRRWAEERLTPAFRTIVALHGLGVADGWRALSRSTDDLIVSRFGVIYVGAAERGDLIASNSDHRGIALPGDHLLVLVHANRSGRIEGVANHVNAFGVEVGNRWTLDLRAGWNLAICRQARDLMTLEYVTVALPDDLRWRTIDPRTLQVR